MRILQKIKEKFKKFAWNYGFSCDVCGAEIFDYPRHRFCEECEAQMCKNDGKTCEKCGRMTVADGVCLTCKSYFPQFSCGISPFSYRGKSAELINRLKKGNQVFAPYFAERMADDFLIKRHDLQEMEQGEPLLIIPVPTTEARRKERGFNQAELLAYGVAERLKEKDLAVELRTDILEKMREAKQQKHASYRERFENVVGVYHLSKRKVCHARRILLVDDIMTTGATGSECAARLLSAGAKEVVFLTATSLPEQK